MSLPSDPFILLSVINTRLRDRFESLDALCEELDVPRGELCVRLAQAGFVYDADSNQFR